MNWLSSEEPSCWHEGVPEFIIERITSGMICSFISEESQWPDGSMKKFGTAESINSALVYYYQKMKCKMPDDYFSEWKEFSKRYKNTIASQIQAAILPKAESERRREIERERVSVRVRERERE